MSELKIARVWTVAAAMAVLVTGCTSSAPARPSPSPSPSQRTRTLIATSTAPAPKVTLAPVTSVQPLRPGQPAPAGERNGRCPYIRAGLNEDPTTSANVADIEGDHVYRTTVLTTRTPVGCRFYYYASPYEAVADIVPTTFPSALAAHNALVLTARAGHNAESRPTFVPGVDGIRYQTRFDGPDGPNDWAFAFAKGRVLVVVHTQQDNSELNAELLARAIAGRF